MNKTFLTACKLFLGAPVAHRKAVIDMYCRIKEIDANAALELQKCAVHVSAMSTSAHFLSTLLHYLSVIPSDKSSEQPHPQCTEQGVSN